MERGKSNRLMYQYSSFYFHNCLWYRQLLVSKLTLSYMHLNWLSSNLWKYFLIQFTNRRNFIPILSVYYLTLPNAHANEIGIYTGIGYLASMLLQIPSGYIADYWWQKNTLILAKLFLAISSILYLVADGFWVFTLASICMSLWANAFATGTTSSLLKWTLEKLGREKEFRHMSSRIGWDVSLLSVIFIILLPVLTTYNIRIPLMVWLCIDIIWLIVATSLIPVHTKIEKNNKKWIIQLIWELRWSGFFPYAFFTAIISGFLFADNVYRSPYLVELGYPLIYIGLVMWWSRVIWWIVGRSIKHIEKYITFKALTILELFAFPIYYIGVGYIKNPWIVGIVFSLIVGWFWGRSSVYTDYFIEHMPDNNYRATILSIKSQIEGFVQIGVSFGIAGIMGISYQLWFEVLGISLLILLSGTYFFWIRKISI